MERVELLSRCARAALGLVAALVAGVAGSASEVAQWRWRAPIIIEHPAAFVRLPLPPAVYARSVQPALADLRLVDAHGERVPFALLAPRPDEAHITDSWREASLYRLPPRPTHDGSWASPVDITIDGGRVTVRQRGGEVPAERSPGWLFDLGERDPADPAPQTLRLDWSGPAEFSAAYTLEHSADLRTWRQAGSGQVHALASPLGALKQPDLPLPQECERFVRLVWASAGPSPQLLGARAATPVVRSVTVDPPTALIVAPGAEPAGAPANDAVPRALHFDLGAALPLQRIDLELPTGNRVLPALVQVRERSNARWVSVAGTVFYRIEHGETVTRSPALAVGHSARYLRIVPDERSALPPADSVHLAAQVQLASLVFAMQGTSPYTLLAGAPKVSAGALPLATLVPDVARERARFGQASVGTWTEVREAAQRARAAEQLAAMRPWLLWGVLLAGVGALGWMVWRLAGAIGRRES